MRVIGPYAGWSCLLLVIILLVLSAGCTDRGAEQGSTTVAGEDYRTVVDSRGVAVQVPMTIERVVTVSDGLIEGTMTSLGVQDTIVGLGSSCLQRNFNYEFPTVHGESYWYRDGMNPVTYLNRWMMDLPLAAQSGAGANFETIAALDPDVIILRVGSCPMRSPDDEGVIMTIQTIESLGYPLIVIYGPPAFDNPDLTKVSEEIKIIGEVFGKEAEAEVLANYLESQTHIVYDRTKNIPDAEKPTVLAFGASPNARNAGGAGNVKGTNTFESYFIEDIVHAKNAFQNPGSPTISAEQLLALDPDVIVLGTANGYHPPEELYSAPYYQNVAELQAVKNQRVYALPWTPCNCAKRLEYPIDIMVFAKAAYPDLFEDIILSEWLLDFYKNVYGVDHDTAIALRSAQWMDWCVEDGI
ncbi:iron complex transport system substrate-binding protein [Methanocalculus alkaliphilus]|uniref:ABC transporter substrate-binding protein n=1 Tax=Methanocalculus alkaliphilus TaxID=768730 RepID=UPI00209E0840|nr:ABC transporter substrate-binding protein [Methanocalculus alkaliphilus]MCP1715612.1 iron complex transport system substrate-binding protein [Methanocalculus alkaliphilus]